MTSGLIRLALLQFVTVVYCILFVGLAVKARFGSSAPPIFASYVREYGVYLLLVPTVWCVWGALHTHRSRLDSGDAGVVFLVGVILSLGLMLVAFQGTVSALCSNSIMLKVPAPTAPAPATPQLNPP
jgi:hypothetical protein